MHIEIATRARPPITLIDTEAEALSDLAMAWLGKSAMGARLLLQELERADTYDKSCLPPHVTTMMSRVVFRDENTGENHEVQLVYPKDADTAAHRISVLTPIGASRVRNLVPMTSSSDQATGRLMVRGCSGRSAPLCRWSPAL